jgi:hypothetical protein
MLSLSLSRACRGETYPNTNELSSPFDKLRVTSSTFDEGIIFGDPIQSFPGEKTVEIYPRQAYDPQQPPPK